MEGNKISLKAKENIFVGEFLFSVSQYIITSQIPTIIISKISTNTKL